MLDAEKAKKELNWYPIYDIDNTLKKSVEWYNDFMQNKNIVKKSLIQYTKYMELQNE